MLKERLRSALKLLSDKKLPTLQPVENHQLNRESVSRSTKKNPTHGCDGSYSESSTNRLRGVSSPKPKLESATPKMYTQVLTLSPTQNKNGGRRFITVE